MDTSSQPSRKLQHVVKRTSRNHWGLCRSNWRMWMLTRWILWLPPSAAMGLCKHRVFKMVLFRVDDRHNQMLCLCCTTEEVNVKVNPMRLHITVFPTACKTFIRGLEQPYKLGLKLVTICFAFLWKFRVARQEDTSTFCQFKMFSQLDFWSTLCSIALECAI